MIALRAHDVFRPFDDLLKDKRFWEAFDEELQDELLPRFLALVVAGAEVGLRLRPRKVEKAYPLTHDPRLSPEDLTRIAEGAIRDYLPTFTKGIADTTYKGVQDAVIRARREGTGTEGVLRDISSLFSHQRAEAIAITETTRLMGVGAQATYRARGINGWEWMTAEDRWVDQDCASRQGELYSIDVNFEPAHPRCRCFPSPALIDEPARDMTSLEGAMQSEQEWRLALSKDEQDAVNIYSTNVARDINYGLRTGDFSQVPSSYAGLSTDNVVDRLDSAIAKASVMRSESTVYRGLRDTVGLDVRAGTELTDLGYMSTSFVEKTARRFMGRGLDENVKAYLLEIKVPSGTRLSVLAEENELLLARGSTIIVERVEGDVVYGRLR